MEMQKKDLEAIARVRELMVEASSYGYRVLDDVVLNHSERMLTVLDWLVKTDNITHYP
jgi:hypothetical protein